MTVSVLVPTYRRAGDLLRCLRALGRQDHAPHEILVVARPEDAETEAALQTPGLPSLRRVASLRPGQVAALNAGAAAASGDVVAITDDDAAPRPDWVRRIGEHFDADPTLGGLGGRDWVHRGDAVETGTAAVVGRVQWFGRTVGNHHLGTGPARDVDIIKGANMSYRRAALATVGFDERLRGHGAQVGNDMAVSLAVKRAGWRVVYDPAVAVDHFPAERIDSDKRDRPAAAAMRNASFNHTLIMSEHLRARWGTGAAAVSVGFAALVGTSRLPGLAQAVRLALRGEGRAVTVAPVLSGWRGAVGRLIRDRRTRT